MFGDIGVHCCYLVLLKERRLFPALSLSMLNQKWKHDWIGLATRGCN